MKKIDKIRVQLSFDKENILDVGEIVTQNQKFYFKYHTALKKYQLQLSPFKLPLTDSIVDMSSFPFDGMAGVFNDSLPDGWGRLLLDRMLTTKGININDITLLDRLAYVGSFGAGALVYQPELGEEEEYSNIRLDELFHQSEKVLEGTSEEVIDELFDLGGSSGGARPKVNVIHNPITNTLSSGNKLKENDEHWIIKFPSSFDANDIANIEYAYYKMALDCGIEMSECKLFYGASGKAYFGTKRFDRIGQNQRLHMHSASGIMHDNFRLSNMDYGHLLDCAFQLERDVAAYNRVFRLACFNVFTHNRDDHSKNFAFLMNKDGQWKFAPAYDLTYSTSSHGFHSTMVAGESQHPTSKDLLKLAAHFNIQEAENIIDEVKSVVEKWSNYADKYSVSSGSKNKIQKSIIKLIDS
ncbi:HipA domain-containing protein [Flammeovirga yaeyamensis]|uniref:HipA domain-containing protein n=1 Tax=Flammeovirga yaeyamensis TaxID=367791 RepID=A0AAX1N6K4_9BACT|nr:type II toxin-antitoxin system HipA family toxin [Flammeovirga yaeyamensis]MBB3698191.1 serine/threonine-protein kinase HipA [Flammeovirga yaeyamensis]NMF34454.1 type II toxin-antitoxin system HipA family toxin [Flammeovirga yaeyamensis]QWG01433.1 HipA domain-containing protein [Flammeovirga yaeyamensis]